MSSQILVTGAGGFIGSHVVDLLLSQGVQVTAMCKYSSNGSYGWLDSDHYDRVPNLERVLGDVTDTEFVRKIAFNKDVVINLAALIGIPYSYIASRSYVNVNLGGTLNILEALKGSSSRLVQISTSEVYGTPNSVPIKLSHPINPQSPYAASKSAADQLCSSYAKSFESQVLIVRPFNTFGPRQSRRAVIPTILSQIALKTRQIKLGSITPKRDFTFVEDTASAIVAACTKGVSDGRVIQLGTGRSISIAELLEISKALFNFEFDVSSQENRIRPKQSEVEILESDPSSALEDLGWQPKVSLEDGLLRTFDWLQGQKMSLDRSQTYVV
jgi:nucleoside-diphosphate-sugar epimerase